MALILTVHARLRMHQRGIAMAWIEATVQQPSHIEPDPNDPALMRARRRIPQHGNRILRVVYRPAGLDAEVITIVFDRGAERWLP
jgi:Domain of unknown function (DUF4258)